MFMIWDSRHEDLQLFWLSFKMASLYWSNPLISQASINWNLPNLHHGIAMVKAVIGKFAMEVEHYIIDYISLWDISLHIDEILVIGHTSSSQNDNFQCSQWWIFCQNDNISACKQCSTLSFLSTRPSDKWLMKFTRPNRRFTRPKFQ